MQTRRITSTVSHSRQRCFGTMMLSTALITITVTSVYAGPGLLLIAHGSHDAKWNQRVRELGELVARRVKNGDPFLAVRTAMLGHSSPTVADAVRELEKKGCDRVIAVPLFIAHSSHTLFDVPTVLGLYFSPQVKSALQREGVAVARPRVPITLCEPVSTKVLAEFAWRQARQISRQPEHEALLLMAHGSSRHATLVNDRLREIATFCAGRMGIDSADWVFADHGPLYLDNAVPAILRALRRKDRVLVLGMYVSLSAEDIRVIGTRGRREPPQLREMIRNGRVVFSDARLVEHPGLADWIIEVATNALPSKPAAVSIAPSQRDPLVFSR
ncbi:MAG: hypothetical protein GXP27_22140 [Planctomycetes bacterium]|nr:hypothetical protein [Planctomycetota bacterium]